MSLSQSVPFPGPFLETRVGRLVNRTETTLTKGAIVAFNLDFAATSGQAMAGINPSNNTDGAAGYVLGAAIAPTTANIRYGLAVVQDESVPDNSEFSAIFQGEFVDARIEGSSGAALGEWLIGTNAAYHLTGRTNAELGGTGTAGAASVFKVVGQLLETGPSGSAANRKIRFWGGVPHAGLVVGVGGS